jgi:hypothetical protein
MLRKIFGPKRDEVTREWRKLHKEELNDLHSSPNTRIIWVMISRIKSWVMACRTYGERKGAYKVLVGKPEGKRPLGRPKHRWDDNVQMDLSAVGLGSMAGLIWLRIGTGGWLLYRR